jgi:hypothetical protein
MKQRMISILEHLKSKSAEGLTGSIKDFRATSEYSFELQTELPGKVFLKWEAGGDDEILRIEIIHGFAYLDLNRADDPTQFLLEMLEENVPSFRGSSASLGLKRESNRRVVCLSSSHQFIATISDKDIAESLSVTIFDLKMAQMLEFPPAVVVWN